MTNQEVWELASKIMFIDKDKGFTNKEFNEIFEGKNRGEVFEMSVYEVIGRINEYREKQRIKIGDVVEYDQEIQAVVLDEGAVNGEIECAVFNENGCVEWVARNQLTKLYSSNYVETLLENVRCCG